MARITPPEQPFDDDELGQEYEDVDTPAFQPLRKQTGKQVKGGDRRQRAKEWGRSMAKYHKEMRKFGNGKP